MLKTLRITTALSGLMLVGALAQTTQQGINEAEKAAQSSPSGTAAGGAKLINAQNMDQWLSSNFIGTDVVGPDNEKIGDVSDILFDSDGSVVGYVVGVGGFLGIGAKNVALAPSSFQVMPATSSTTGTGSATAASDDIKLKLNMTKDQLKQAASFESKREQESKSRAASQPAPGSGMNRPQSR
jgi:hypothetical protein